MLTDEEKAAMQGIYRSLLDDVLLNKGPAWQGTLLEMLIRMVEESGPGGIEIEKVTCTGLL